MPIRSKQVLLVVHDDPQLVRQITKMASEFADVITARDITRATALAASAASLSSALVVSPISGASPLDICGAIRTRRAEARIILLADPADLTATIEALHSGLVDHVINRPLRERELLALLTLPAPRAPAAHLTVTGLSSRAPAARPA